MQIYEDILTMQVLSSNPAKAVTFGLKGHRFNPPSEMILNMDIHTSALFTYVYVSLGPTVRYAQPKDLTIDEEIFDLVTVDLANKLKSYARKMQYYDSLKNLLALNVIKKQGYHGHVYTVNPYIMNRLKGKHCKHLKDIMHEFLRVVQAPRQTLTPQ